MKIFTNIYHYLVFIFILLTISVVFVFYFQPVVQAEPDVLTEGQITGWGWTDTYGWISLNCVNVYAGENLGEVIDHCDGSEWADLEGNLGVDYGVSINTEGAISGRAWADNIGWIDFDPDTSDPKIGSFPSTDDGLYDYAVKMDTETGYLSGWATALVDMDDPNDNAWIRFREGTCDTSVDPDEDNYCVRLNEKGYLVGWAWSESETGEYGLGWIRFEQTFSGGAYLQTQYSDIYSGGTVTGSRAPEGEYNATYCILSGGDEDTINLSSSQACLLGNIDIDFPSASEEFYQSSLVNLDLVGLKALAESSQTYFEIEGGDYNIADPALTYRLPSDRQLDGQVYYFTGVDDSTDFTVDNIISFQNGTSPNSGAGTIIINGDLYINQDIDYLSSTANALNQVASIAWIVLGDVYIAPTVKKAAGTFIVLGNGDPGSGKFDTGNDSVTPNQFTLEGMVIAKSIVLSRTYFVGLAPAEIFKYDGRVLVNTPPGLSNFAGYLPSWNR